MKILIEHHQATQGADLELGGPRWERQDRSDFRAVWSDAREEHERRFANRTDLLEWLGSFPRTQPGTVVEVMPASAERSMSIALGGDETVLTYEETAEPPYWISLGDRSRAGTTPLYVHGGQGIDHLARNLVPLRIGLAALGAFLEGGHRPSWIDWEKL
jgi:hypothetical protein